MNFTFSAVLAGIAGALYVPQVGIINPGEFSPIKSIEIVVWVALGGRGFLYGAIIGAIVVNVLKSYLTIISPEIWIIFLGLVFIFPFFTIFLSCPILCFLFPLIIMISSESFEVCHGICLCIFF